MTDFERATIAAHLTAALITNHGHLAAAGVALRQPKNANVPRTESVQTSQEAVALYHDVLTELQKSL